MDLTMIPTNCGNSSNDNGTNVNMNTNNSIPSSSDFDPTLVTTNNNVNIEEVFPVPNVIIKDLFDVYKGNKSVKERDSALLDYVKILFNKLDG